MNIERRFTQDIVFLNEKTAVKINCLLAYLRVQTSLISLTTEGEKKINEGLTKEKVNLVESFTKAFYSQAILIYTCF